MTINTQKEVKMDIINSASRKGFLSTTVGLVLLRSTIFVEALWEAFSCRWDEGIWLYNNEVFLVKHRQRGLNQAWC